MPPEQEDQQLVTDYTRAERLGNAVQRIGSWKPWWGAWTWEQYLTGIVLMVVIYKLRHIWGPLTAGASTSTRIVVSVFVLGGIPIGLAYAIGKFRPDARSPFLTLLGVARASVNPGAGTYLGKPVVFEPELRATGKTAARAQLWICGPDAPLNTFHNEEFDADPDAPAWTDPRFDNDSTSVEV